ncbi:GNAT family N-acetyltransferase [Sphingobacterium spiritivorum]|uniref:GNAT family N-acetyltransferase n=1 Tax=Sphingobacterium spiritivorum TaxID=258 RepID=UPI003DA33D8A
MIIRSSTRADIDNIFDIYEQASAYKLQVSSKGWKGFRRDLVEKEIDENRHFVILEEDVVACTFLIVLQDEIIWKDRGSDPAIYIHRIATNPSFRGNSYVKTIVKWAKNYALEHKKKFIRLDTHSGNEKINEYYKSCGFTYQGISQINWQEGLPEHYKEGSFSLFEIAL